MNPTYLKYFVIASLFAASESTNAQLINGNFETGDFTGWTLFNTVGSATPYGIEQGGSSLTQVIQFDTAGTGVPSYSAEFEVGETSGIIGGGGLGQGAGIFQNVMLGAGQITISLDIAATSPGNNADAGTFELLLDGNVVASDAMGGINVIQTLRSTLSYSGMVAAGTHEIAIDIRRGYGTEYPDTPFEYLDNISLSGTAVPEPSVFGLLALGSLCFGGCFQFRYHGSRRASVTPKLPARYLNCKAALTPLLYAATHLNRRVNV